MIPARDIGREAAAGRLLTSASVTDSYSAAVLRLGRLPSLRVLDQNESAGECIARAEGAALEGADPHLEPMLLPVTDRSEKPEVGGDALAAVWATITPPSVPEDQSGLSPPERTLLGPRWVETARRRYFRATGLTHLLAVSGHAARKAGRADSGMRQRGPSRSLGGLGERQDASALSMLRCNTSVAVAR
jgi:hypothetical protein